MAKTENVCCPQKTKSVQLVSYQVLQFISHLRLDQVQCLVGCHIGFVEHLSPQPGLGGSQTASDQTLLLSVISVISVSCS
jgi:hypothetical protein